MKEREDRNSVHGIGDRYVSEAGQRALLAVGAVALAVDCVYLALVPPATGYETSLVEAYPPAFWLSFGVGLAVVVTVFVASTVRGSRHWRPAFGLLAALYGIFFFLPVHRGYRLYGRGSTDGLAHLGFVKQILATESVEVFYPMEHLLIAELSHVGVPPATSRYLLPFAFTLLFIGSVGVLVRAFVSRPRAIGAGLCAATPLVFTYHQIQINPFLLSFLLFPLVVFLLERTRQTDDWRYRLSAATLGLGIVFFHPVTAVFLLILVVSTTVFARIYAWYDPGQTLTVTTRLGPLVGVASVWWYSRFGRTERALSSVIGAFDGGTETLAAEQTQQLAAADLSLIQAVTRLVLKYGVALLVLGVAGLYTLAVIYRVYRREQRYPEAYATLQYAIGGGLAVLFLLVYLIADDPVRVSRYAVLAAIVLVGLLLVRSSARRGTPVRTSAPDAKRTNRLAPTPARESVPRRTSDGGSPRDEGGGSKRTLVLVVVVACVLSAAVLGSFVGTTYWPNKQMTHAEYQGAEFLIAHNDPSLEVHAHSLHEKMQWFVTGNRSKPGQPPVFQSDRAHAVPRRLGYDANETVGRTFGRAYLVTQAYDVEFSRASYYTAEQQRSLFVYGEAALARLRNDSTADRVYANGGFTVWNVTPRTGRAPTENRTASVVGSDPVVVSGPEGESP